MNLEYLVIKYMPLYCGMPITDSYKMIASLESSCRIYAHTTWTSWNVTQNIKQKSPMDIRFSRGYAQNGRHVSPHSSIVCIQAAFTAHEHIHRGSTRPFFQRHLHFNRCLRTAKSTSNVPFTCNGHTQGGLRQPHLSRPQSWHKQSQGFLVLEHTRFIYKSPPLSMHKGQIHHGVASILLHE